MELWEEVEEMETFNSNINWMKHFSKYYGDDRLIEDVIIYLKVKRIINKNICKSCNNYSDVFFEKEIAEGNIYKDGDFHYFHNYVNYKYLPYGDNVNYDYNNSFNIKEYRIYKIVKRELKDDAINDDLFYIIGKLKALGY